MSASILDAAAAVLAADPAAGMGDIAVAAGVGRATLYRRYETREDLVTAVRDRIRGEFRAAQLAFETTGDLHSFVLAVLRLREAAFEPKPDEARRQRLWAPLKPVVAGLVPDLPADWAVASLRGLIRAAGLEVDAGRLDHEAAAALVVRTFLR